MRFFISLITFLFLVFHSSISFADEQQDCPSMFNKNNSSSSSTSTKQIKQIIQNDVAIITLFEDGTIDIQAYKAPFAKSKIHAGTYRDKSIYRDLLFIQGRIKSIGAISGYFAFVLNDGSVINWGLPHKFADKGFAKVANKLSSGVEEVVGNDCAFAARKTDGSVITWGMKSCGGDSSKVADKLSSGVVKIVANYRSFAVLKEDGSVVTWGDKKTGGDSSKVVDKLSSGVKEIISMGKSFVALKYDGTVVTWGDTNPEVEEVLHNLTDIKKLYANSGAVLAEKNTIARVAVGSPYFISSLLESLDKSSSTYINKSSINSTSTQHIKQTLYNYHIQIVNLLDDGSVEIYTTPGYTFIYPEVTNLFKNATIQVTEGNFIHYDNTSYPVHIKLSNIKGRIKSIAATLSHTSIAFIFEDGSVICCGNKKNGGDISTVADKLSSGVKEVVSTVSGYAALKYDGSVVTWGDVEGFSKVADKLSSGVVKIISNGLSFAALKEDGSVVTWGLPVCGGDSSKVADKLSSGVKDVLQYGNGFIVFKYDGTHVFWGQTNTEIETLLHTLTDYKKIYANNDALRTIKKFGTNVIVGSLKDEMQEVLDVVPEEDSTPDDKDTSNN